MEDTKMSIENKANPHTIKKFEIIERYVEAWIQKLMNFSPCREIFFIDCMCNTGIYKDVDGNIVEGTPIRVAKIISTAMVKYADKKATLYFNDKDFNKIQELKKHLPQDTQNCQIYLSCKNGNDLLKELSSKLIKNSNVHYLLFYDPYDASIDWSAISPYFFGWGEVIINHVVSDTIRAITSAKRPETVNKYEQTYLKEIQELVKLHSDKNAYDKLVKNVIKELGNMTNREYYLAAFPFFIKTNTRIYNILFFTKNKKGFKLFKETAWQVFGGKSSNQNTHGKERMLSLFEESEDFSEEKQCYFISDIANYIAKYFQRQTDIPLQAIWELVDDHPIFPTGGYKTEIKKQLKSTKFCKVHRATIDFI